MQKERGKGDIWEERVRGEIRLAIKRHRKRGSS